MAKRVDLLPLAVAEAESAASWYAERDVAIGTAFAAEIERALQRIAVAPARWPVHLHGARRVLLKRFPFFVVYREDPERILVVAVAHAKKKPGYWRDR